MFRRLSLLILMLMPGFTEAVVTINEVAWMGDLDSANHEWIELYNSGSAAVSVEGWTLSDGLGLSIALSGTIGADQYAVLERTSDESVPGVAFHVYTGALVNTGATLVLRDDFGVIKDQISGGEGWQNIGGDNTTKETAQYTNQGWKTAPGTPGQKNVAITIPQDKDDGAVSATSTVKRPNKLDGANSSVSLNRNSKSELPMSLVGPDQVFVNQPVEFLVVAEGSSQTIIASLKHNWNFGDMSVATGTSVTHRFLYPGTYVTSVRSRYRKHDVMTRKEVTVLPIRVTLGRTETGDVIINNTSPYEIDISGHTLLGSQSIRIPDRTIILERSSITVPSAKIEKRPGGGPVSLFDQAESLVASTVVGLAAEMLSNKPAMTMQTVKPDSAVRLASTESVETLESNDLLATDTSYVTEIVSDSTSSPEFNTTTKRPNKTRWPYVALLVIIGGVLLVISRFTQSTVVDRSYDDW